MKPILNKLRYAIGILMLGGALSLGLYGLGSLGNQSFAENDDDHNNSSQYLKTEGGTDQNGINRGDEDDYDDDHNSSSQYLKTEGRAGQNLLNQEELSTNAITYQTECASCHLAYPAHLLPKRSWQIIMATLPDHYGDDASLSPAVQGDILAYLSGNSAVNNDRMLRRVAVDKTPLRITELPYFKGKHREIPERMVKDNPKISSFSQCDSCHKGAAKGQFDEDNVVIPGFGRWDD
jgi:hypothetical protein